MFEWDEAKRIMTLVERKLDFADGVTLFDGRPTIMLGAVRNGEARWLTVGLMDNGKCYSVVWTQRDQMVRIISYRRSHDDEERTYHARHG